MVLSVLLLLVGFAVLIKGADFLVTGATSLAARYNISKLAIGLTIVAFGTSTPELVVSIVSSLSHRNDAIFGNIIGSNNFNLLFILGISGIIYPLVVQRNTARFEVPLSLLAVFVLAVLVNDVFIFHHAENILSRVDAFVLLLFFLVFMVYVTRTMRDIPDDAVQENSSKKYSFWPASAFTVLGIVMLILGGKIAVDNAIEIARYLGWSQRLIGLTILAAGTSLPELMTSAVAAYRKHTDIAVGNIIGSNIFNIFFILGITGMIHPIPFNLSLNFDIIILLGSTVLLMIFMYTAGRRKLDRWEAVLLVVGYLFYTAVLIQME